MDNILIYIFSPVIVGVFIFLIIEYFKGLNRTTEFKAEKLSLQSKLLNFERKQHDREKEISDLHNKTVRSLKKKNSRLESDSKTLKEELEKFDPGRWRRRLYDKRKGLK